MTCGKRKRGFNGFRFCGLPAAYRLVLKVNGQDTVMLMCKDCALTSTDRGTLEKL